MKAAYAVGIKSSVSTDVSVQGRNKITRTAQVMLQRPHPSGFRMWLHPLPFGLQGFPHQFLPFFRTITPDRQERSSTPRSSPSCLAELRWCNHRLINNCHVKPSRERHVGFFGLLNQSTTRSRRCAAHAAAEWLGEGKTTRAPELRPTTSGLLVDGFDDDQRS